MAPETSESSADETGAPSGDPPDDRPDNTAPRGGMADWMAALRDVAPYLDLGWRLAASAAGPPLLGHFLVDAWLGTSPWGVLGGATLGIAAAVLQLRQLHDELGQ